MTNKTQYTTDDLKTDIEYLKGYGINKKEAEQFIQTLLKKTLQSLN